MTKKALWHVYVRVGGGRRLAGGTFLGSGGVPVLSQSGGSVAMPAANQDRFSELDRPMGPCR